MQSEVVSPSSRRRSRHDSSHSASSSTSPAVPSTSSASAAKRAKLAASSSPNTMAASNAIAVAMSRAGGKLTDAVDLSRPSAFTPHSGAKKLVIKNLRRTTTATSAGPGSSAAAAEEYYARTLQDLDDAIRAIFDNRRPVVPLERLYRGVEDVCRRGSPDKVYRMLKDRMEAHVHRVILPRVDRYGRATESETLKSLLTEWQTWNSQMILVRSTFSYLDRTYLLREKQSINDMTISYFRKMAFPDKPTAGRQAPGHRLVAGICDSCLLDRTGAQQQDAALLKGAIRMLYVLDVYVKHFEPLFLRNSEPFFVEFAGSHSSSNLKTYIRACETLLNKEQYRCHELNIDSTTEKQLMKAAHKVLISDYSDKLVDSGSLFNLMNERDTESMKGLYDLLSLSQIQLSLKDPWVTYVRDCCSSIIADTERGDEMVVRLLELRRALDLMIRDSFGKDDTFLKSMRDAFGHVMNNRQVCSAWKTGASKVGEMIAKHIDLLLRGGLKSLPKELLSDVKDRLAAEREGQASTADEDAELDRQLDQALELFRFLEGKDAFEAFYKKDLARRLLMGRSASQDAERSMLAKLRAECGSNFTHNLEQMFRDQELGREELASYKAWCQADPDRAAPLDLSVMILSAAAWPTYPDVALNLPDDVAKALEQFEAFYQSQHKGRNLTWKHALGHCAIKARFAKGAKELLVSAFQAVVLFLFNTVPNDKPLSFEQISDATGLKGADLKRTLQSLACGKSRVLTKHPKGRDVDTTDTFTFNKAFSDPKYRVKINQIQLKESKEENKATYERIAQDRRFETQAAIVRIMKSRKKMGHAELTAEVINMTRKRGSVEPAEIKKEIESLIEKDYIEREDGAYVYLA